MAFADETLRCVAGTDEYKSQYSVRVTSRRGADCIAPSSLHESPQNLGVTNLQRLPMAVGVGAYGRLIGSPLPL